MHAIGFGPRLVVNGGARRAAAFDFTGVLLPAGAHVARASAASVHDAGGVLAQVPADVARFDHDPVTLAPRGLLLEGGSTNMVAHSADWTDPYWSKSMVAASATALIETAMSGAHTVRQSPGDIAYAAGQTLSVSLIARERSGSAKRYLLLQFGTAATFNGGVNAIFDLAAGTAVAVNGNAGTTPAGGGAWLCWLTATALGAASGTQVVTRLNASPTAAMTYSGDGTSGFDVAQIQVEPGPAPTSRIVTGAGPATRAADVLTLDWRSRGVADGTIGVRYAFDDGSTQTLATVVAGGMATVPLLARRWLRSARAV